MKKILLITISMLFLLITFTGCSSFSEIQLTKDNASNYLNIDLNGGGILTDNQYSLGEYDGVYGEGTIQGLPGYKYNDVVLTIKFNYSYSDNHGNDTGDFAIEETVYLSDAGNATISVSKAIDDIYDIDDVVNIEDYYQLLGGLLETVTCNNYEITSASGTISQI